MANIGPVGEILFRRKHRDSELCPQCHTIESNKHIIMCTAQNSIENFLEEVQKLNEWLQQYAPCEMRVALIELILAYHDDREPEWEKLSYNVRQIAKIQWDMGNHLLLWGVTSLGWRSILDEYLHNTRKSSKIRMALICGRIWEITDSMWMLRNEHEHKDKDNVLNRMRNENQNILIDRIYNKLPSMRFLPMSDRHFFNKSSEWIKKRKLKDKIRWVKRASIILNNYNEVGNTTKEARVLRRFLSRNKKTISLEYGN